MLTADQKGQIHTLTMQTEGQQCRLQELEVQLQKQSPQVLCPLQLRLLCGLS